METPRPPQEPPEPTIDSHEMSPEVTLPQEALAPLRGDNIVEHTHADALSGESFEDAAAALADVEILQEFRKSLRGRPFGSFYELFEDITNINKTRASQGEKEQRRDALIEIMEERANHFSPRVADLYLAILSDLRRRPHQPKFSVTTEKMSELLTSDDLLVLTAAHVPWDIKRNRIEKRLDGYLAGVRALDRRDGNIMDDDLRRGRQEKLKSASSKPHGRRNRSKPGMDEMNRLKEGERVPAIWAIYPAYGGYFRGQSFSSWDSQHNEWTEEEYEYSDPKLVPLCTEEKPKEGLMNLNMTAKVDCGVWTSVPIPYTHGLHDIKTGGADYSVQQDQNGDIVVMVEGTGEVTVEVILAPTSKKVYGPTDPSRIKTADMPAKFSEETEKEITRIVKEKKSNLERAQALAAFTRRTITYSNESTYNGIYDSYPDGYFAGIDHHKKADCDVANTYFAALAARLDIPVRHVVGHSVKGKDPAGSSNITSGTGHAWSEVWEPSQRKWVRVDATSSGDPNLEEQEPSKNNGAVPGDYGGQEAVRPTDEQLEALRKKLAEQKLKLSYTKAERSIAATTGIELHEARQIVKEITIAENTRLPNGELLTDVLAELFNAIVESRKVVMLDHSGPVRKSEGGGRITHIVRHKIGAMSGQSDPVSREKPDVQEQEQKVTSGFDVIIIGDKSGSMGSTVEGEALWSLQRRAEYLIFSSLHRFAQAIKRAGIEKKDALPVRTQGLSFRGSDSEDIDEDKPLSPTFSDADKVKIWHSLTNRGSSNGDVAALSIVLEQIKEERTAIEKRGEQDTRLRLVVACSDGGPDDSVRVHQLVEELGKLNAVVVGIGLTETAAAVPIIYTTPYSRGDIAKDINDLPAIIAKYLVGAALALFPERAKDNAKKIIARILAKLPSS